MSTEQSTTREPLVDATAVAELLGVSSKWIERNAEALNLPRRKIGGRWRFRLSEVDAWIDAQGGAEAVSDSEAQGGDA